MIDYNNLPEFAGIQVYDRNTGDPVTAKDILPKRSYDDWLVADDEGLLIIPYCYDYCCDDESCYEIPKEGKYIVQVGTEMYRW